MNIIIIVLDSLRADHVGCYGSEVKTPNIDALAAESAVMEQAYSENMPTLPCRAAWWMGRHFFPVRGWQPFEHDDLLLAEILSSRGYTSALVTDTYHMHRPGYNCGRGFDTTVFVRGQEYDPWIVDPGVRTDLAPHHRLRGDDSDAMWRGRFEQYLRNASMFVNEEDHCAARVADEAVRWLERTARRQKDNIFLWLDSFSPHEPWDPPSPYREMYDPGYTGHELIDPVPGPIEGYMTAEEVAHTRSLYAGVVTFTGESLLPILSGDVDAIRDHAVSGFMNGPWSLRTKEWTFLLNRDRRPPELYNRMTDRAEQHNDIADDPDVADALELRLRRLADEVTRG